MLSYNTQFRVLPTLRKKPLENITRPEVHGGRYCSTYWSYKTSSVYPRVEWKGAPPCPFLAPPLFSPALVPLESIYMRPAYRSMYMPKTGVCFSINHVLRQYTSITADIELTIVKLLTDGIVYHTYSS